MWSLFGGTFWKLLISTSGHTGALWVYFPNLSFKGWRKMVVKHLLMVKRGQRSGLWRVEPDPVGRAATANTELLLVVGLELLRRGVLGAIIQNFFGVPDATRYSKLQVRFWCAIWAVWPCKPFLAVTDATRYSKVQVDCDVWFELCD